MGKPPYIYTESESEDTSISSTENKKKKKKRFSILKYTRRSVKKQKCKLQSKSEPDDSDYHSKGSNVRYKIPGILKHSHVERERETSDDDSEPMKPKGHDKYLVGRVPRPAGTKPGRGEASPSLSRSMLTRYQARRARRLVRKERRHQNFAGCLRRDLSK